MRRPPRTRSPLDHWPAGCLFALMGCGCLMALCILALLLLAAWVLLALHR